MISDLILSIFAFYFYLQYRTLSKRWSMFFLLIGLSAFVGGIYHGFPNMGDTYKFLSWTLFSGSLIFAQLASYHSVNNKSIKSVFILKSILLLFMAIHTVNFEFIVFDAFLSMFGFIVIGNLLFLKSLSPYITYGILISFTSAFFLIFKISFSPQYMNYNDIGHYISILSIIVISKGVREDSLKQLQKIGKTK